MLPPMRPSHTPGGQRRTGTPGREVCSSVQRPHHILGLWAVGGGGGGRLDTGSSNVADFIRSDNAMGGELPLPSLSISGFRGFENLSIPQLGRVTLLTGRNGVGKTTVLDAIRIHAAATYDTPWPLAALLADRLRQQDEWRDGLDEDGDEVLVSDYTGLFHGRSLPLGSPSPLVQRMMRTMSSWRYIKKGSYPKKRKKD